MRAPHLVRAVPIAIAFFGHAPRADACGGFFCSTQPVIQTGEQIIFGVDPDTQTVHAVIQIAYQGQASEFAWILPLPSAPSRIAVGSNLAFSAVNQRTRPSFQPRIEFEGACRQTPGRGGGGAFDAAFASRDAGTAAGGVNILSEEAVGPYDTVVLEGTDATAVRAWLTTNGYNVTDAMMTAVVPYLAKGDKLLALKLQKQSSVGDLQPIALELRSREACIPIRLTAIAAQADMEITAVVLSDKGRSVPTNYRHVRPNLTRINWLQGGSNYRQLIGQAADEAGGNAFTTEFHGRANVMAGAIYSEGRYDLASLRTVTNLQDLLSRLQGMGLTSRSEMRGILRRHADMQLTAAGIEPNAFWGCVFCYWGRIQGVQVDAGAIADEIDARIVTPDREAQQLFDRYRDMTRLYTLLSPEEMNVDPIFDFDPAGEDVSNVHTARVVMRCGDDGIPGSGGIVVTVDEDSSIFSVDRNGNLLPEVAIALPASAVIEQYPGPVAILDNQPRIKETLADDPATVRTAPASCGCSATGGMREGAVFALAALSGLVLVLARRGRRV